MATSFTLLNKAPVTVTVAPFASDFWESLRPVVTTEGSSISRYMLEFELSSKRIFETAVEPMVSRVLSELMVIVEKMPTSTLFRKVRVQFGQSRCDSW